MAITIYHNPKCGTSRGVLEMICARGIEPTAIEYLKTPPDAATLKALLGRMGVRVRDLLRRRGTPYDALGLDDEKWTDDQLIGFIAEQSPSIPRRVWRPISSRPMP